MGRAKRETGAGTKLVNCSVINVGRHRIQHDIKEEKPVIYQMLKSANALGKKLVNRKPQTSLLEGNQ